MAPQMPAATETAGSRATALTPSNHEAVQNQNMDAAQAGKLRLVTSGPRLACRPIIGSHETVSPRHTRRTPPASTTTPAVQATTHKTTAPAVT